MHREKRSGQKTRKRRAQGPKRTSGRSDLSAPGRHTLTFGRHRGKTIAQVDRDDPVYLEWIARKFEDGPTRRLVAKYLDNLQPSPSALAS